MKTIGPKIVSASDATSGEPRLLHEFFERQAQLRPDHAAIECNGETLSYIELAELSEQIAMSLQGRGVGPGSLIGLYSEKSTRLYAAMLGILKAGAAYVPIDPKFPIARIQSVLADADVKLVLSDGALARDLGPHVSAEVVRIEEELASPTLIPPPMADVGISPTDACYVIYTSGSTGQPKGVVIEHRNAVNFVHALSSVYRLTQEDRVYQGFSIAFDASVEEIWAALSLGGTLLVPNNEVARSPLDAAEFINKNSITFFSTVPSFLALITENLPSVKLLVLGGEACSPELVNRWAGPGRRLLNTYGPTEATVVATAAECLRDEPVMIGGPLPGYETFVLDEDGRRVAAGEVGELYIGGASIARGYLNRPELTAERFISNPLEPVGRDSGRLYRTFDLVRLCDDGGLQFVGRSDGQIKIRGFRVELGEIEAVLMECPQVRAAVVNVVEFGTLKELAAYVVTESGTGEIDRESVAKILRARLPEYMIPRYLDVLEAFPTMTSGKVDKKMFPAPRTLLSPVNAVIVPAESELERILVSAMESEFRISPISVEADFFRDLHGHSLNAGQLVAQLRSRPETATISVHDLYMHRTTRRLARHLGAAGAASGRRSASEASQETAERNEGTGESASPPWFRYPCALLQLIALIVYYGIYSSPLVLGIVLVNRVAGGEMTVFRALDIATTASLLIWPSWLLLSIAVKWIVIGRYKPGRYRVWGFYYFRWWLVNRFQTLSWSAMFVGTPLMSVYYRAMGASVGKHCTINTPICGAFDLLSIGDGTSIGSDTHLLGYRVENGWLIIGTITLGSECYIGTHCCIGPNTSMGDRARLGDMSHLIDGTAMPADAGMRGSPAEPAEIDLGTLATGAAPIRGSGVLFGLLHLALIYAMGYLLIASTVPGFALIAGGLYFGGPPLAAAAAFVAAPVSIFWYLLLVLAVKWIAIGRIWPGVYALHSASYLRYWFLSYLLNNTRNIVLPLYATLFLPKFLKGLGARIGRNAEISTTMHIMPDLLEIGDGSFLADACMVGTQTIYRGHIELRPNKIGAETFVGNSALVPGGVDIGNNSLIGVMSTPPTQTEPIPAGTRWLGSPGFELPNTERMNCFSRKQTFEPGYGLVLARLSLELLRVVLPSLVTAADLVLFCMAVTLVYRALPLWAVGFVAPVIGLILSVFSVAVVALIKVALVDRFEPSVKPLWCSFVWLNEVVNALYESNAAFAMAPLMGTPYISSCLRMMGCKVGRWVFLDTTLFSEFDLVDIGDYAAVNFGATIQTHLFEDRVMKADHLKIGESCSVGNMAVVLYGTEMKRGSSLGALSVLMKGEILPEFTRWVGIPTRRAEPGMSAGFRRASADTSHNGSRTRRRMLRRRLSRPSALASAPGVAVPAGQHGLV